MIINNADLTYLASVNIDRLEINGVTAIDGSAIANGDSLTLVAANGFEITSASLSLPNPSWSPYTLNFSVQTPPDTATATFNNAAGATRNSTSAFTVNTTGAPIATYEFRQIDIDDLVANNLTLEISGVPVAATDTVSDGDTMVLVAATDFTIVSAEFKTGSSFNPVPVAFTVNDPPETASLIFGTWNPTPSSSESVFTNLVTEQATPDVLASNNVYLIDNDILNDVNLNRFVGTVENQTDLGKFILGVISLPFELDPTLVLSSVPIRLGTETIGVNAPEVSTDKVLVNLGSISVASTENNLRDYQNRNFELYLPYSDKVLIDPSHVVDETLTIEYEIDLYSGEASIRVFSSAIGGEPIYNSRVNMGVNVPYLSNTFGYGGSADNFSVPTTGDNTILTPFLVITKNDEVLPNGFFTVPILDEGSLSGRTGFVRVEEINLATRASSNEMEQIKAELSRGVIINAI